MRVNAGLTGKGTILRNLCNSKYNNIQCDGVRAYDVNSSYT